MTRNSARRMTFLGLLAAGLGSADSVTWIDHASSGVPADRTLNGIIRKVSGGEVTLEARFASGSKTYPISITSVRRIEFNTVAFNPGAPPQVSALGDGPKAPATTKEPIVADAIELRGGGGQLEPCKVVTIDENTVRCEAVGKARPKEYPRTRVLRVVVRGEQ